MSYAPQENGPQEGPPRVTECPVCKSTELVYAFSLESKRYESCSNCRLVFANPQLDPAAQGRDLSDASQRKVPASDELRRADARALLDLVYDYCGITSGYGKTFLGIGTDPGYLVTEAKTRGFSGECIDFSRESNLSTDDRSRNGQTYQPLLDFPAESFDVCVLLEAIAYVHQPVFFMESVWRLLKPDGTVLVAAPSVDRLAERHAKSGRAQSSKTRQFYFEPSNFQMLLYRSGFGSVRMRNRLQAFNLEGIPNLLQCCPLGEVLAPAFKKFFRFLPSFMKRRLTYVSSGEMIALTSKEAAPKKFDKLSVVLPVYNEDRTFPVIMKQLLNKTIPGMAIEIVIVESNSTDNTRELALQFKDVPQVKIVLEDRPRGKGHAVRSGISEISGDIILIQDGDLEYDLWDYEALLMPIVLLKRSFVLGSRHTTSVWKMRKFKKQPVLAAMLNLGHHALTSIVNLLYRQGLKDPFTMFKVFRSDCIRGMTFECDRFDFDIELVIKMIQRGFIPKEIPVNYSSRSFEEGKKVSFLKDPIRILSVILKQKLTPGAGNK